MKMQLVTKNANGKAVKRNFNKVNKAMTPSVIKSTAQDFVSLLSGETPDKVTITTSNAMSL